MLPSAPQARPERMGDMANLGFPWGRIILSLATLAAIALAVGFILKGALTI